MSSSSGIGWAQNQPESPATPVASPGLMAEQDWEDVCRRFHESAPYNHAVIDDFLNPEVCVALRAKVINNWGWYYKKPTAQELYLRDPDFEEIQMLSGALRERLPTLFDGMQLVQSWSFLHHRNSGLKLHCDNGQLTLNLWLTPDEYNLDGSGAGLVLSDVRRTDDMAVHEFASTPWAPAYIEKHTRGESVKIPYRYNRAVLFDARIFHGSDEFRFDTSSTDRSRVNLSLLFDYPDSYQARLDLYNETPENETPESETPER